MHDHSTATQDFSWRLVLLQRNSVKPITNEILTTVFGMGDACTRCISLWDQSRCGYYAIVSNLTTDRHFVYSNDARFKMRNWSYFQLLFPKLFANAEQKLSSENRFYCRAQQSQQTNKIGLMRRLLVEGSKLVNRSCKLCDTTNVWICVVLCIYTHTWLVGCLD